ncbi:dihydrofolate reductase [Cryomorphaceae bacterium]|nr:dihydrofolate reductase [Cryomorphaceae bacterium]
MVILYIATTLDGFIADSEGSVNWIPPAPEGEDFGYADFYASCSHTVQGGATYRQVLTFGDWPYPSTQNLVYSRSATPANDTIEVISTDLEGHIRALKAKAEGHIWCIGGGSINGQLLAAGLIDEVWQFVLPVNLGSGIPLFGNVAIDPKAVEVLERSPLAGGGTFIKYRP